jgi:hypothetical protein
MNNILQRIFTTTHVDQCLKASSTESFRINESEINPFPDILMVLTQENMHS